MSSSYAQGSTFGSKRAVALVAIIALHVLVIYAFAKGLATNAVAYVQTIIQTSIIQTEKPKQLPPPPPPVDLKQRPPVQVVAPEVNISIPADTPPPPITMTTTRPVPKAPPAPVRRAPVVRTGASARWRSTEDYYPSASQRANEEGRPVVEYCVSANNRLTSVQVQTSSGFPRLDDAAVALVKASAPFKAATEDGKPIDSCGRLAVKFQIR